MGLTEEKGLSSWRAPGAVDRTEWINQIRTISPTCTIAANGLDGQGEPVMSLR